MNKVATAGRLSTASAAALLAAALSGAGAAPTTSLDDSEIAGASRSAEVGATAATGATRSRALTAPGLGSIDRSLHPETSTGNKNLDLLLELQGRAGEERRQEAPRSAAAAALADLRAKAAERPAPERPAEHQAAPRPVVLPFEAIGTPGGQGRLAPTPTERREWTNQLGDGAGGTDSRRDPYRTGDRESDAIRGGYSESLLRRLPQEAMAFLRENRYWLLGALGVAAVLGAALKSYSRRI